MSSALAAVASAEPKPLPVAGITPLDMAHARANNGAGIKDWRRLEVGRLYVECLSYARRKRSESKGFRKSETDSIAADMVVRIAERIGEETADLTDARKRGASTPLRYGAPLPRGRVMRWSEVPFLFRADDGRTLISGDGWRLLTAAYNAVLDNPRSWREGSDLAMVDGAPVPREVPTDPFSEGMSVATRAVLEREAAEGATALMVDAGAEELATAMGLRADEARAVAAASVMHRSASGGMVLGKGAAAQCAREWGISPAKVGPSISNGRALLRKRFLTGGALVEAIDAAHTALADIARDALSLAAEDERHGYGAPHAPAALPTGVKRCGCLACAARRYSGVLAEVREAETARLIYLARNASPAIGGGWVIQRAPHDAIAPYVRSGLMMGALAYGARTARAERAARALSAQRSAAAIGRRHTLPYMAGAMHGAPHVPNSGRPYPEALTLLSVWAPVPMGTAQRAPYDPAATVARLDARPLYWQDGIPTSGAPIAGCGCETCTHLRMVREAH